MIEFICAASTITLDYNHLWQLTIGDCLRLLPFPSWTTSVFSDTVTGYVISCGWLILLRYKSSPLLHESRLTWILILRYITTDGQSASLSWNKAPIWGLRPDFYYCLTSAVFLYGAPSLTRGRVCLLECTIYNIFYCLIFETRSLYLYPPGRGWPGYTPRHWVLSFLGIWPYLTWIYDSTPFL
jgi:hypothetical protein